MQRTASATAVLLAVSVAPLSLAVPVTAQQTELPTRKPGQWEIKTISMTPGAPPTMVMTACVDAASDMAMMQASLSLSEKMCPRQEVRRQGNAYVIDATCHMGPMSTESHIVITGDFQSTYAADITTETTGANAAMAGTNMTKQEARWLGAECRDGLEPGDIMMPGETKMNVDDMIKMMDEG